MDIITYNMYMKMDIYKLECLIGMISSFACLIASYFVMQFFQLEPCNLCFFQAIILCAIFICYLIIFFTSNTKWAFFLLAPGIYCLSLLGMISSYLQRWIMQQLQNPSENTQALFNQIDSTCLIDQLHATGLWLPTISLALFVGYLFYNTIMLIQKLKK